MMASTNQPPRLASAAPGNPPLQRRGTASAMHRIKQVPLRWSAVLSGCRSRVPEGRGGSIAPSLLPPINN